MSWDEKFARLRKRLATQRPRNHNDVPFRVPAYLREVKPQMYTAQTVSLGLNDTLEPGMEQYKADFQRSFLKWKNTSRAAKPPSCQTTCEKTTESCCRWTSLDSGKEALYTWDDFIEGLDLDEDVKAAYRWYEIDTSPVSPHILKNFLALDALFLVLYLRCRCQSDARPPLPEHVHKELQNQKQYRLLAESRSGIWRDVFLLENQIPLHILSKVWISMPDLEDRPKDKALRLFDSLLKKVVKDRYLQLLPNASKDEKQVSKALTDKSFVDCPHLLDCVYYLVCYSPQDDSDRPSPLADEKALAPANTIPSAVQLKNAGIRLKSDGILFIHQTKFEETFWGGRPILHIPQLYISEQSESLLRNLAVHEMVSCPCSRKIGPRRSTITSFLVLMDKLIQSTEDVELMRKHDIIISCLGSNGEMIEMWNTLCKGFSLCQSSQWRDMLTRLTTRYKNTKLVYFAEFRAKYFERPWVVASSIAGVVLLGLTGLQTAYTTANYYQPPMVTAP